MKKYIYADKLIKDLNDLSEHYTDKGKEYHPHIDFVMDTINQQPTADVRENIKSVWIEQELQSLFGRRHTEIRCGNCGYEVYKKTPFCPNCGADIREVNHGRSNQ